MDTVKLRELAGVAAAEASSTEETEGEALRESTQLLTEVLALVAPGMRPTERIPTKRSIHNCNNCHHPTRTEYAETRGVVLVEVDRGSRGSLSEGNEIQAFHLYYVGGVLPFMEAERRGHESHWQNAWWGWEATLRSLTALQVVEEYNLEEVMEAIEGKLAERLEKLATRRIAATARLDRVRAARSALS